MMATTKVHTTLTCDEGKHGLCFGFVAPMQHSSTRPCGCACHDDGRNPRNWGAAYRQAERSFYGAPVIGEGVEHGSLVDLVTRDGVGGLRVLGRFDGRQASGPCVVALRRSSLADNGYRRVRPGDRVELARVRP